MFEPDKRDPSTDTAEPPAHSSINPSTRTATNEYTLAELEKRSRSLGAATNGFTGEIIQSPQQTSSKVFYPLQEWLSASESRTLYIYGPPNTTKPSDLSLTSAFVVSMMTGAKLSLLAHQCQNSGSEMEALISMVYSIVIQLTELLPLKFSTGIDFSPDRFESLDRSPGTLAGALVLMEELLTLAPRQLIVVLDGLQLCEDGRVDKQGTGMFLNFFLAILKNGRKGRILKVLFTTDGSCDQLWRKLDPQEQIDVMSEGGGPAAHRRKGGMALADLVPEY